MIPIALATSILAALCFGAKLVLSLGCFASGWLKPVGSLAIDCDFLFLKLFLLTAGVLGVVGMDPPAPRTLRSDPF